MYMYKHFDNIRKLYGNAYVQIPNGIFKDLSKTIKTRNKANIKQVSFAYAYLVTVAFLYKYAHFVDIDNRTYIQNSDIKQMLGYGKTTKTIDNVVKKDGILEQLGLIQTTKDYPVSVEYTEEVINDIRMREFVTVSTITDSNHYSIIKDIVKNRNYEIREPLFFFDYEGNTGSLYNYELTHKITIQEYLSIISDDDLDNIDFLLYAFLKYKCHGFPKNTRAIALYKICLEAGIGRDAFYSHLDVLEKKGYVDSIRKGWRITKDGLDGNVEANEYVFKGIS